MSLALSVEKSVFIWGPLGNQDLTAPVWIQDLDQIPITSAAVGHDEIILIEDHTEIWKLVWDETAFDV